MSPETLRFLRESEAREWIARYQKKAGEVGAANALSWWQGHKVVIAKIRGEEGLRSLVKLMEQERAKSRIGLPIAGAIPESKPGQALDDDPQGQNRGKGDGVLEDQMPPQAKHPRGRSGVNDHL
jgi:hypothetical protein